MADSSQKFIARNRAPRVQIEYDVELYGAEKKVQLPFVMGVMSDLVGKSSVAQPAIADRKFLEIDVDNFDERMRAMAPRAAFTVPNTLTGEGNLAVDLTFESMADFTPGAVAKKVDALRPLLEARQQLEQLMTYMDGKSGAEDLIEKILTSPSLLSSLAGQGDGSDPAADAALESLRQVELPREESGPDQADVLSQLAARAPAETSEADASVDILAGLKAAAPTAPEEVNQTGDVLAGLAAAAAEDAAEDTHTVDTLADLAARAPAEDAGTDEDTAGDILSDLARQAPAEADEPNTCDDALAALAAQAPEGRPEEDVATSVLSDLAAAAPEERAEAVDTSADVLADLAQSELPEEDSGAETDAILGGLERAAPLEEEGDSVEDVLSGLEPVDVPAVEEGETDLGALLGDLKVTDEDPGESVEDVLSGLEPVEEPAAEEEDTNLGALLGDLGVAEEDAGESVEDVLSGLEPVEEPAAEEEDTDLGALLGDLEVAEEDAGENVEDVLSGLEPVEEPAAEEEDADLDALLGDLEVAEEDTGESVEDVLSGLEAVEELATEEDDTDLDALLGSLNVAEEEETATPDTPETDAADEDGDLDLDALLAADEDEPETSEDAAEEELDLDALLAGEEEDTEDSSDEDEFDLDSLLAEETPDTAAEGDLNLDALLADNGTSEEDSGAEAAADDGDDDLEDLLAGLDLDDSAEAESDDDLDALLSGLDAEAAEEEASDDLEGLDDLDALLGDLGDDDDSDDLDLDSLLGDLGDDEDDAEDVAAAGGDDDPRAARAKEPELAYGTMSADRPEPNKLMRKRFRLAVFGDFTGRASKGQIETGEALAARKPMVLDPDTFEDVIESFATELVLPIGKEGAGIEVKLGEFDDLHPDELYDNVALFSELAGLRKQLQSGVTQDHAMKTLASWAEAHGTPARAPKSRSGGNAVPADKRLSDFQRLIGDTDNCLRQASPVEEMLARVVGPHIRALPDPSLGAMQEAVDLALSDAMRLVLHHPEFQSVEAQWRSLDLIQRSIEVDDTLDVMLYDVSAEELAADLAAHEDLSQSGFVRLLTEEPMDEENGRGAYSALIGLYTFEETPPHAELLGRIARVAAHVDAPFLASITPGFWDHAKEDRPKIVADAWDTLTGMSEAGHLGLLTPRFLLRRPYGAKGEPIDPFDFEEFTQSEGLRGMLWGNPVVLAAILMAKSFKENGASLQLGSIMSFGDMPFHYVTDRFGDQVALPCTERNVDLDKIAAANARGFMPIAGVRGRDEIRLTSFNSLRGEMLLGPWTGEPAPAPSPPDPRPAKAAPAADTETAEDGDDLDLDLDLDFDSDGEGGDDDLDALLASFDDDDDSETDGDIDADLEALLNDL